MLGGRKDGVQEEACDGGGCDVCTYICVRFAWSWSLVLAARKTTQVSIVHVVPPCAGTLENHDIFQYWDQDLFIEIK